MQLRSKRNGGPTYSERLALFTGDLRDAAIGTEVAVHYLQMSRRLDWVGQRPYDLLAGREARVVHVGKVLIVRATRHRHLVTVKHSVVDQKLDHARRASDVLDILHDELSGRLKVGQERRLE